MYTVIRSLSIMASWSQLYCRPTVPTVRTYQKPRGADSDKETGMNKKLFYCI